MKNTIFSCLAFLCFPALAFAEKVSSITEFGITWTFDRLYESGHFANGDSWVVGPVKIISINPPCITVDAKAEGHYIDAPIQGSPDKVAETIRWTKNGSMLNPSPSSGVKQGYDNTVGRTPSGAKGMYDPSLNVANGVSGANPLIMPPNSSLVSTISRDTPFNRPQPNIGAVLTVLNGPAPEGSFRPPYSGNDKTIKYNKSQLKWDLLLNLPPVASTPKMEEVEKWFEKPWLDHGVGAFGGDMHPITNLPDYGREMVSHESIASLMLLLDIPKEQKEKLLIGVVQVGIDINEIYAESKNNPFPKKAWSVGGGTFSGRKWPIIFAGVMLGDKSMQQVEMLGMSNEDGQTYYGKSWTGAKVCWGMYHGLSKSDNGGPSWDHEEKLPSLWTVDGRGKPGDPGAGHDSDARSESYRNCCTSMQWVGEALAVRLMGATKAWSHDAFFDYVDRWMTEDNTEFLKIEKQETGRTYSAQRTAQNKFVDEMWAKYRSTVQPPPNGWKGS